MLAKEKSGLSVLGRDAYKRLHIMNFYILLVFIMSNLVLIVMIMLHLICHEFQGVSFDFTEQFWQ